MCAMALAGVSMAAKTKCGSGQQLACKHEEGMLALWVEDLDTGQGKGRQPRQRRAGLAKEIGAVTKACHWTGP